MQRQKRMKRSMCYAKDIFGREDRRLRDLLFSDLDFLRKVKDRTICEERMFRKKEREWGKFRIAPERSVLG